MKVRIENWSIVWKQLNEYSAPEDGFPCLLGHVFNHPLFPNGSYIQTSELIKFNIKKLKAKTKNTTYKLCEMDILWSVWLRKNGYKLEDFNFSK